MTRNLTDEEMDDALRSAYLNGRGDLVLNIWRTANDGALGTEDLVAWVGKVSSLILESADGLDRNSPLQAEIQEEAATHNRLRLSSTALRVTGLVDEVRDRTVDRDLNPRGEDRVTLTQALSGRSRTASERIWRLIHNGKASQTVRELWLDFVAHRIWKVIEEHEALDNAGRRKNTAKANQRAFDILAATGLHGQKPRSNPLDVSPEAVEIINIILDERYTSSNVNLNSKSQGLSKKILSGLSDAELIPARPAADQKKRFQRDVIDRGRTKK